jgi:hypothetical protein
MPIFESTEKMHEVLGSLFQMLADDPEVGPKANAENINIVFYIHDPEGQIWLLHGDPTPTIVTGPCDATGDIEMWISGDDCHAFWLQKATLPVLLAKRKVKAKGPMAKVLGLLPLLQPAFDAYPGVCEKYGLPTDV